MTVLEHIFKEKIIAILRGLSLDDTLRAAEAVEAGGIKLVEIPFDQTRPPEYTMEKIRAVCEEGRDRGIMTGAGTVLTKEQVHRACEAGASYIITPTSNQDVIREAKELGMAVMPGAMTPTEIEQCYRWGADVVKVFPSDNLGTSYIKAVRGPLSHIPLAAVGGVDLDNIRDFFAAGVCCVGIGGNIVNRTMVEDKDFDGIRNLAAAYVARVQ